MLHQDSTAALNRRRRSEQHAYDINNIVIPYSIASTTRVEKLQYKEIMTPKWRIIEHYGVQENNADKISKSEVVENHIEDLSDELITMRHLKCEVEEKRRFLNFVTPGTGKTARRSGSMRIRCDSKTDLNGFNEDTTSQDSFPSGLSGKSKVTNQDQSKDQDSVHGAPARAFERRRTTSSSRTREDSIDDDQVEVTPYERRTFPLDADQMRLIVKAEKDDEDEYLRQQSAAAHESRTSDATRNGVASHKADACVSESAEAASPAEADKEKDIAATLVADIAAAT